MMLRTPLAIAEFGVLAINDVVSETFTEQMILLSLVLGNGSRPMPVHSRGSPTCTKIARKAPRRAMTRTSHFLRETRTNPLQPHSLRPIAYCSQPVLHHMPIVCIP